MKFVHTIFIILLPVFILASNTTLTPPVSDEIRLFNDYTVDTTDVIHENIRLAGGDLTVNGTVKGRITVYGGAIYINSTAVVDGEIIAIGGTVHEDPDALINGKVIEANLKEGIVYRDKSDEDTSIDGDSKLHLDECCSPDSWIHPEKDPFVYNRNEGLVLSFNSSWDRHGKSSLRLNVTGGWRFEQKTYAGRITLEQSIFPNKNLIIFGSGFRETNSDDTWRMKDWENSVATILAKQDFLDRWDETGYEYGIGADLRWFKLLATRVSVKQEEIPVASVWSLFHKERLLRPNMIHDTYHQELYRGVLAFKPIEFDYFDSGLAFFVKGEQAVDNTYARYWGLLKTQLRVHEDYVIRTRVMAGTSTGELPDFRQFGVGGMGSVAAHPYKEQIGNQFTQVNLELSFTPEFFDDDFSLVLFADAGNAWNRDDYDFSSTDKIIENSITSAGIGVSFFDDEDLVPRVNFARSLSADSPWETTIRLDLNF